MAGLLMLLGCAAAERAATDRDQGALAAAAGDYWGYVRWGEAARAAAFLSTAEQRAAFGRFMSAPPWRITGAELLTVEVGERLPREGEIQREGRVSVRLEHLDRFGVRLESEIVEQGWEKAAGRWRVAPGAWGEGRIW